MRDRISSNEKLIEKNHSELRLEGQSNRALADDNKAQIDSLNKKLALLDDKIKQVARGGAGGGNAGAGGLGAGLLEDLEAALAKLRDDHENHKSGYAKDQAKVKDELAQKASKADLEELEARMMQRL